MTDHPNPEERAELAFLAPLGAYLGAVGRDDVGAAQKVLADNAEDAIFLIAMEEAAAAFHERSQRIETLDPTFAFRWRLLATVMDVDLSNLGAVER